VQKLLSLASVFLTNVWKMVHRPARHEDFLLGYTRTTLLRACARWKNQALELDVWLNRTGSWEQLAADVVQGLCDAKRSRKGTSLCGLLLKGIFRLSAEQYTDVKTSFDDDKRPGPNGIYRATDRSNCYAIAVQLPHEVASDARIQSASATALAALALGQTATFADCLTALGQLRPEFQQECAEVQRDWILQRPVSRHGVHLLQGAAKENLRLKSSIRDIATPLQKALEEAKDDLARLEADLAQARAELTQSQAQVSALQHALEAVERTSKELQSSSTAVQQQMETNMTALRQELHESRARMQRTEEALIRCKQPHSNASQELDTPDQKDDEEDGCAEEDKEDKKGQGSEVKDVQVVVDQRVLPTKTLELCSDPLANALATLRLLREVCSD